MLTFSLAIGTLAKGSRMPDTPGRDELTQDQVRHESYQTPAHVRFVAALTSNDAREHHIRSGSSHICIRVRICLRSCCVADDLCTHGMLTFVLICQYPSLWKAGLASLDLEFCFDKP
jgi:hypothetical protein